MYHLLFLVSSLGLTASAEERTEVEWKCWDPESGETESCRVGYVEKGKYGVLPVLPWCIQKGSSANLAVCPSPQEEDDYYDICDKLNEGETAWLAENTWCCGSGSPQCDTSVRKCGTNKRCQSEWCYRRGIDGTTCPLEATKDVFKVKCSGLSPGEEKWLTEEEYCCKKDECPRSVVPQQCSTKTDNATTVICAGKKGIESTSCLKSGKNISVCLPEKSPHKEKCENLNYGETMWLEDSLWCCRGVEGSQIDCDTGIRKCGNDAKCNSTWCFGQRKNGSVATSCPSVVEKGTHDQNCINMKVGEEKWIYADTFCCNSLECQGKAKPPQKCSKTSSDDTTVSCNDGYGHLTSSCIKSGNGSSTCLPEEGPYEKECMKLMPGETMWLEDSLWCFRGVNGSQIDCHTGIRKCGNDTKCKSDWCIGKNVENLIVTKCPSETEKKELKDKCAELGDEINLNLASGDVCCKNIQCKKSEEERHPTKKNGVSGLSPFLYFLIFNILLVALPIFI